MKKWVSLLLLTVLFTMILAGCSDSENKDTEQKEAGETAAEQKDDQTVTLLVNLQMEMIQTIRQDLEAVISYEQSGDDTLRDQAVEASNKIANALRGIEVPAELSKELQVDLKESIELLSLYFEERAATLKPDTDMTEMDEAFAAFHEQIGAAFQKAGLHAPNFEKDVQ